MLRNQENVVNENKEYMKEVQEREEQSFKEMVEPLENELFNKACQMEEKANLIEQYFGQIAKMQDEIGQLQEEIDGINEEIQLRKVNTEKISLAQQTICKVKEKVVTFVNIVKEKVSPKSETNSVEKAVEDVKYIKTEVAQSNLKEETKNSINNKLDKIINVLLKK